MMGFGNALYDSPACQVHCAGHFDCSTTFGCDGCGHYFDCVDDDDDGDAVWRRSASFATLSNRMTTATVTSTTSTSATSIATTNVTVTVASGAFTASFTTTVHRSC